MNRIGLPASEILSASFYNQPTNDVARALLGQLLVRVNDTGDILSGIIVETEAYLADDPASHSYRGKTTRNAAMYGPPGHAYVYISYGMHMMLNLVCQPEGIGEAVLIRAIEPDSGIDIIQKNRGETIKRYNLTNGPGKLAQALQINVKNHNGTDITHENSRIKVYKRYSGNIEIVESTRIGISAGTEHLWRYYIKNNPYVSKR